MSDRKWAQDVWSVLMDDGTEHLDVVINQSDHNAWTLTAPRHKWAGDEYNVIMVQFCLWKALTRRGDIRMEFEKDFLPHIAALNKEQTEEADPTRTGI